jgi:hypothetical protein
MLPDRGVNWTLLGAASLLPMLLALAIAWPFWRKRSVIAGNTAGLAVLFISCLLAGGIEYVDALRFSLFCQGNATGCRTPHPSNFIRLAAFGFIAMVQAMALYVISGLKERRLERSHYESRWR